MPLEPAFPFFCIQVLPYSQLLGTFGQIGRYCLYQKFDPWFLWTSITKEPIWAKFLFSFTSHSKPALLTTPTTNLLSLFGMVFTLGESETSFDTGFIFQEISQVNILRIWSLSPISQRYLIETIILGTIGVRLLGTKVKRIQKFHIFNSRLNFRKYAFWANIWNYYMHPSNICWHASLWKSTGVGLCTHGGRRPLLHSTLNRHNSAWYLSRVCFLYLSLSCQRYLSCDYLNLMYNMFF